MKAYRERAVVFGAQGSLAGVLTIPSGPSGRRPAIVILNAGIIHHVGPNRLHVRLARAFAPLGHTVLRFDLSGIGDSEPRGDETDLARAVERDISDALAYLASERQVESVILCGLCSGAVNGFLHAVRDERVKGVIMIDPLAFRTVRFYLVHVARRVFSIAWWQSVLRGEHAYMRRALGWMTGRSAPKEPELPSPAPMVTREEMDRGFGALTARGTETLVVFSGGLDEQYNYASQFRDVFPHHAANAHVRVKYFPRADHTFSDESAKDALKTLLVDWLRSLPISPSRRLAQATDGMRNQARLDFAVHRSRA